MEVKDETELLDELLLKETLIVKNILMLYKDTILNEKSRPLAEIQKMLSTDTLYKKATPAVKELIDLFYKTL